MSRSSPPEGDSGGRERGSDCRDESVTATGSTVPGWTGVRLPDRRGQTEPIAALAALLAVGVGLALYAGVATDAAPEPEHSEAAPAMERLSTVAVTHGTLDPAAIPAPADLAPNERHVAVTLLYDGRERRVGPAAPPDADRATRSVSVRTAPGDRQPGRVVVEVWT